jgi:hypothetical protein
MSTIITRKDTKRKVTSILSGFVSNGYRTIISNGENHFYIDTCYTDDCGNESMVFKCDENGKVTDWHDLDCRRCFDDSEMEKVHNEMVQNWIKKLERGIRKFDPDKILTCVTADKAMVGTKGYFGDDLAELKCNFKNNYVHVLLYVNEEYHAYRFKSEVNDYALFYPIEEVEE